MRRLGQLVESIHAVVYFTPEPLAEYAALGRRGYWRGYFASRGAALGEASALEIERAFAVFAPTMVERSIPSVWSVTSPAAVSAARQRGAEAALTRLLDGLDVSAAVTALRPILEMLLLRGQHRPLVAALAEQPVPSSVIGELWWQCTLLREDRGVAHLAALADAARSENGRVLSLDWRGFVDPGLPALGLPADWDEVS